MQIVLALSLTGYLLPWDQKGFWATRVATNLMGLVPVVGEQLQQLVVGGPTYGHATLTRFFALHAGVLARLADRLSGAARLSVSPARAVRQSSRPTQPDCDFWPDQVLKDAVACLAVLCVVLGLVDHPAVVSTSKRAIRASRFTSGPSSGPRPIRPTNTRPRGPNGTSCFCSRCSSTFPARPKWSVLVVPGAGDAGFGRDAAGRPLEAGSSVQCRVSAGADRRRGLLTTRAWWDDHYGPGAADYLQAVADADEDSERAAELAAGGIPPEGAIALVRRDPKIQGRKLFAAQCAQCHDHQTEPAADGQRTAARRSPASGRISPAASGFPVCSIPSRSMGPTISVRPATTTATWSTS